jgi:hypothetical protein
MPSLIPIALACTAFVLACDTGESAPDVARAAASVSDGPALEATDPMLVASCHAGYREAFERIEAAREEAASCSVDSDCTLVVSETRCTGELVGAVSAAREASFLDFVSRVDARLCADAPASCSPSGEADPEPLEVACVEHRCALVD